MLLAAGVKGKRSALKSGTVMLHQPRGNQARGQASDIAIKAREVLINRQVGLDIMAKDMGVSVEKLAADTNRRRQSLRHRRQGCHQDRPAGGGAQGLRCPGGHRLKVSTPNHRLTPERVERVRGVMGRV